MGRKKMSPTAKLFNKASRSAEKSGEKIGKKIKKDTRKREKKESTIAGLFNKAVK